MFPRRPTSVVLRLVLFTLGVGAFVVAGFVAPRTARTAPDPAMEGAWSPVMPWPMVAVHAHLLPTGGVLIWNRGTDHHTESEARIWDWKTGQFTAHLAIDGTNIFCTGHALLGDGRLLVAGGHLSTRSAPGISTSSTHSPRPGRVGR